MNREEFKKQYPELEPKEGDIVFTFLLNNYFRFGVEYAITKMFSHVLSDHNRAECIKNATDGVMKDYEKDAR